MKSLIVLFLLISNIASAQTLHIGTAHSGHFKYDNFPLSHFDQIVDAFKPDAILIEALQDGLNSEDLSWALPEMHYLNHLAQRVQVPVFGIDSRDATAKRIFKGIDELEKKFRI